MSFNINFSDLNMKIPDHVYNLTIEEQLDIYNYLNDMDKLDRIAYEIAFDHLGTSFSIERSNGFKEWKTRQNK